MVATCEYCKKSSMQTSSDQRVCVDRDCVVGGLRWERCEHCRSLTVPVLGSGAPRVCVRLCSITLGKQCASCKGLIPDVLSMCVHPGCERAFRRDSGPGFEPIAPALPTPIEGETRPGPDVSVGRDPFDEIFDAIGERPHFERRYELMGLLFHGGMGEILVARDLLLGRDVAMKRSHPNPYDPHALRAQLLKEARVGARLVHPHILPVHDFGVDEDRRPYLTMRLVKGASLRVSLDAIATGCRTGLVEFPLERILRVLAAACQAMHHAHGAGVLHLDLKPDNILVSEFGEVFVIDWGLALVDGADDTITLANLYQRDGDRVVTGVFETMARTLQDAGGSSPRRVAGTPGFMAPEQWEGIVRQLDPRTDVFGLGGILHYILFEKPPYAPSSAGMPTVIDITLPRVTPIPLRQGIWRRPGIGQKPSNVDLGALEDVCRRALYPDPAARFQTVEDMERALRACLPA